MGIVLVAATVSTFGLALPQLAVYVAPSIVALIRRPARWKLAIVINLLLGWTIVGWIVAIVLAFGSTENGSDKPTFESQLRAPGETENPLGLDGGPPATADKPTTALSSTNDRSPDPEGCITLWFRDVAQFEGLDRPYDWYFRDVAQLHWTDDSDFASGFMNDMGVALILMTKIGDALYRQPKAADDIPVAYGTAFVFSAICQEATFKRLVASAGTDEEIQSIGLVLQKMSVGIAVVGSERERAELLIGGRHPLLTDGPFLLETMRLAATPELQESARALLQSNS